MPKPRILIVEDEIIIARELEVRLRGMGYDVCGMAKSGEEALQLVRQTHPDLVLMDVVLKGDMDGIEASTIIRRECSVPVIYVTAYTDDKTLERAAVTEPFAYIVKPFSEREIRANIEMALYKHRMEDRLNRIEKWFGGIKNGDDVAVIVSDLDGAIRSFNHSAEIITAWPRGTAMGKHIEEVFRLVSKSSGRRIAFQNASEGPIVNLATDTVLLDKLDREVPVDCTTTIIRDALQIPTGRISVFRDDLHHRTGALNALTSDITLAVAESMTLLGMLQLCTESMVRNLNAAFARIWTMDASGKSLLLRASAGCYTRIDGRFKQMPIGTGKIGLIALERKPHLTNDVRNDERIRDREWARKEGMVAFAGYPLMVGDRVVGVMAMFSRMPIKQNVLDALGSIARTVAMGVERKRLEDQLRHVHKLEALGQLAGGVAHDFNNLLTVILGNSTTLVESLHHDPESRRLADEIVETSERAATLTQQLLAFGSKQQFDAAVHELNGLVLDSKRMLRRLIGENIELEIVGGVSPAYVYADRSQLEQVVVNLAVNARDAMPKGGKLTISVGVTDIDVAFFHGQTDLAPCQYVVLTVSDDGTGMSREVQARIFEPYFTTKEVGEGTGIGLATVYGIVRQSNGYVHVYSEIGMGTTFRIFLPQCSPEVAEAEPIIRKPPVESRGTETVLLVEDDPHVCAMCKRILENSGFKVLAAGTGDEALYRADTYDGPIHLVVTDVVMPGLSGKDLVERLLVSRPDTKLLFMSGYSDDALVRHGIMREDIAYLSKPFGASTLTSTVRNTLDT